MLDLLRDKGILGGQLANTPIDQNHKLQANTSDQVSKEQYQQLVGRLIYLSHIRLDIVNVVSIVNQYTHDLRTLHLEVVLGSGKI